MLDSSTLCGFLGMYKAIPANLPCFYFNDSWEIIIIYVHMYICMYTCSYLCIYDAEPECKAM